MEAHDLRTELLDCLTLASHWKEHRWLVMLVSFFFFDCNLLLHSPSPNERKSKEKLEKANPSRPIDTRPMENSILEGFDQSKRFTLRTCTFPTGLWSTLEKEKTMEKTAGLGPNARRLDGRWSWICEHQWHLQIFFLSHRRMNTCLLFESRKKMSLEESHLWKVSIVEEKNRKSKRNVTLLIASD